MKIETTTEKNSKEQIRIRVAGIIPLEGGYAFMHRVGVKNHPIGDYYTFAGGGLEENETLEEGTKREIKEEFGIEVEIVKKMYEIERIKQKQKEYFFLCKYIGGKFGTGTGPEFSNNPKYAYRGKYKPEIIKKEDLPKILLLPTEIRDKFIEDINKNTF